MSLLKDLTKEQCEFASNRAKGLPATSVEKQAEHTRMEDLARRYQKAYDNPLCSKGVISGTVTEDYVGKDGYCVVASGGEWKSISPGDIKTAECFQ